MYAVHFGGGAAYHHTQFAFLQACSHPCLCTNSTRRRRRRARCSVLPHLFASPFQASLDPGKFRPRAAHTNSSKPIQTRPNHLPDEKRSIGAPLLSTIARLSHMAAGNITCTLKSPTVSPAAIRRLLSRAAVAALICLRGRLAEPHGAGCTEGTCRPALGSRLAIAVCAPLPLDCYKFL
ncbi:hypothetical protein GQ53DRAFT_533550 [Thozetella sp. PMI_491]|nr:hypothetical protein GQ53DRAFT_533550 [Thozetella sp. PMI_491]